MNIYPALQCNVHNRKQESFLHADHYIVKQHAKFSRGCGKLGS